MKSTRPGRRQRELLVLRLLHLADEVGSTPHVVGFVDDRRARGAELVVADRRAVARRRVSISTVAPIAGQLVHAVGGDRDPVLALLHLAGDPDRERTARVAGRPGHDENRSHASVSVVRSVPLDLVELGRARDQRRRQLHDGIAAVVGPADQAEVEQAGREEPAQQVLGLLVAEALAGVSWSFTSSIARK